MQINLIFINYFVVKRIDMCSTGNCAVEDPCIFIIKIYNYIV